MFKRAIWALGVTVCLAVPAKVQAQGQYVDVGIIKVKPEKVADFEAIAKKIADVNRRGNGDQWLAMETVYGEANTYVFSSRRQDYAGIDKGNDAFMNAMNKAYGKEGAEKVLHDINNCVINWRNELRLRRPDLSSKAPTDAQGYNKMVGESRVLRTIAVHIRPGRAADFEALMKEVNSRADQNPQTQPVLVSQVIEGGHGDTFYITFFRRSLGGFDQNPTLHEIMGDEGLAKFEKTIAEAAAGSESAIYRFSPEMSNPPQEIAEVAADFWHPKAVMAAAAKPKAASTKTPEVKPTSEKPKP